MSIELQKPELLAPAGDTESFQAALRFGADAVYLGGNSLTMRAGPKNFTTRQLAEACTQAHGAGKQVYFTCNALLTNGEAAVLEETLLEAADAGVDAFIVADVGVLMTARRVAPNVAVHISTQAGVTNWLTARELYNLGAARVVLARELTLEDIGELRARAPKGLELEVFIHGAMCVSFSGRCLLSQYMAGRDANRGSCAQPCRWQYQLMEQKRPGEYYPIAEDEGGAYILNANDLCTIDFIDKIIGAGVSSLKIEGRAKSAYYVAAVTGAYRRAVDLWAQNPEGYSCPPQLMEEVAKVSHRPYSTGFYFGPPEAGQNTGDSGYIRQWDIVAVVEGYDENTGRIICSQRNKFACGATLEALVPGGETAAVEVSELFDGEGNSIPDAPHPMMTLQIPGSLLPQGSFLRKATGAT